jgi:hypothetical protein
MNPSHQLHYVLATHSLATTRQRLTDLFREKISARPLAPGIQKSARRQDSRQHANGVHLRIETKRNAVPNSAAATDARRCFAILDESDGRAEVVDDGYKLFGDRSNFRVGLANRLATSELSKVPM